MNIFKLLFQLFLLYMAYKFIFHFIIPVYRTTKQMKKKMSEMHNAMQEQQRQQQQYQQARPVVKEEKAPSEDYIEFEEIK